MKKISNEAKVGAVALVTIVTFIWLYSFLKGRDLFNPAGEYYVVYNEIGGLAETSPVEINGYKAGVVQTIEFINDQSGRLLVKLSIHKDFTLPRNTVAEITNASLIAGMKVQLLFGKGPGVYKSGDTIPGRLAESVLKKFQNQLTPVADKISGMVVVLDSVLKGINDVLSPEFRQNIRGSMAHLNSTSRNVDEALSSKDNGLKKMTSDISRFTEVLSRNSDKLGNTISNAEAISDTLAAADLYSTVLNLKSTLEKTSQLLENMNKGKGTTGQLVTNDSLYINLNKSVESLDVLLKDIQANPKRYFSIFGKKNK